MRSAAALPSQALGEGPCESVPLVVSKSRMTRDDRADSASRHADERVKAVRDGDAQAGRTVTVQRRKLCAEIAHQERRNRPLSVAIGIE
jgi:hypothetical protein